jgi:hypothetical protein
MIDRVFPGGEQKNGGFKRAINKNIPKKYSPDLTKSIR